MSQLKQSSADCEVAETLRLQIAGKRSLEETLRKFGNPTVENLGDMLDYQNERFYFWRRELADPSLFALM